VYVFGFRADLKQLVEGHPNEAFPSDFIGLLVSFLLCRHLVVCESVVGSCFNL